jgi:hypothetical protein
MGMKLEPLFRSQWTTSQVGIGGTDLVFSGFEADVDHAGGIEDADIAEADFKRFYGCHAFSHSLLKNFRVISQRAGREQGEMRKQLAVGDKVAAQTV